MRIRALAVRIWRQFLHDKRTLALMLVAPLLIMTLVSLVFNGATYHPKIGTVDIPAAMTQRLAQENVTITHFNSDSKALAALKKQTLDAYLDIQHGVPQLVLEGSDPSTNKAVLLAVQKSLAPTASAVPQERAPNVVYLYGSADMSSFDNFGPVLIGFFSFFFVFLVAGISFLKERTTGTLERLVATPIRRYEIVAGYVLGFGIFTTIQAGLIAWYAVDVLGMMMNGQLINLLLITFLLSMTALTFGIFLSSFANSEFQMMQFIPLVIVPQVFFSGLFNIDTMAEWLRWLSRIMPLYYGADALRNVMIRGRGLADIAVDLAVLLGLSIAFMVLNVLALRKYRKV
ncbi:ABC transporter permease [Alicyclobacillus fastidiosus]|uniref:ABC transporter permease n=1 Tax=Alicyclobacillus fastidiosus TaxID=392011 RepID=A0ABV5AEF2_9BACL|nr:ABC transporter permease [Alicyclobacillus fastidiosus]WEH09874.1 ABC transporter permease [Alicyclobacillus fastidiosus]